MEDFWTWVNKYGIGYDGDSYLGLDKCVDFDKEIWFLLGNFMWMNRQRVYQEHLK